MCARDCVVVFVCVLVCSGLRGCVRVVVCFGCLWLCVLCLCVRVCVCVCVVVVVCVCVCECVCVVVSACLWL